MSEHIRPEVDANGVPRCSYENCPQYDGKRCKVMGRKPYGVCEPAVAEMAEELQELRVREYLEEAEAQGS